MSFMIKICLSLLVVMMAMTANAQTTWLCDSSYVVNKDGQRTAFTEYSYDNGVLLEELNTFWSTSWDGQQIAEYTKTAYEYDEAGRVNKITDYEKKDDKWTVTAVEDITQFNENGDPTEIIYYEANEDDEGQLQPDSKKVATYEGRLMTQYDLYKPNKYFWLLFSTTKCEYNDQGLMTKRTTSREAFGITNVSSMTYEYDTHGNVTKEVYETDDYSFTYTYENTYDANDNLESVKEFIDGKEDDTEYFFWSIGGHTALKGVKASAGSACTWFDLNGRRLSGQPDRKGIFVRDGKKVMIK